MRHKKLSAAEQNLVHEIQEQEQRLFPDQLDDADTSRMKSTRTSWHYRPSHHVRTGLLTTDDLPLLRQSGRRLLSIGAYPAYLEQVLCALGIPSANILLADSDPAIADCAGEMETVQFDVTMSWPAIGTFDRIIFPESMCIAISDALKKTNCATTQTEERYPTDALEATLLSSIIGEALRRLRPGGEIRANGPMSHPAVVKAMSATLRERGLPHTVDYQRFFLTIRVVE